MEWVLFIVGGVLSLGAALAVILERSSLQGALWLIVSLCGTAVLFIDLGAGFLAVMQVFVYAGAVAVLFLFVIMLLHPGAATQGPRAFSVSKVSGAVGVAAIGLLILRSVADWGFPQGKGKEVDGGVASVGTLMVTDYLFAIEAVGVLLLVAAVGSAVMNMRGKGV